jgi:hypothetical protein
MIEDRGSVLGEPAVADLKAYENLFEASHSMMLRQARK